MVNLEVPLAIVPPPHVSLQRLTEEEAQEQERLARAASEKGASIWNQVLRTMPHTMLSTASFAQQSCSLV